MVLLCLHCKVRRLLVEDIYYSTISAWVVQRHHLVACQLPCIDSAGKLGLFEYSQVHVGLSHAAEGRLQSAIMTIPDNICTKPDHSLLFGLPSNPLPEFLHTHLRRKAHPLLMVCFFLPCLPPPARTVYIPPVLPLSVPGTS